MLARVSNIEAYRQWKNWQPLFEGQDEPTVEDLVRFITVDEPSEAMKAGTAFHKAMENAGDGLHTQFEANGYQFLLPDAVITLPTTREMRAYGQYGGLTVTGQVDGVEGRVVIDHKTTGRFDPERYLNGCQWKFYLDIFDANEFRWNVFVIKELEPRVYGVSAPQTLTAYRYPEMHDHCAALAADYLGFARVHLREEIPEAARFLMAG
ncbi:hypothetical protein [Mesorhizobium sp. ESP-6-2]|uniref:hypothetical protein n=1 Tax=Mesorhizobium sp. ESP-6-2 TaxID=2876625 RepID=UPI001CC99319|nr:hypothetical protein [Mesorhizobium sp. ESP-6-2]MBZ9807649.1 hypothetical protein [Mesorhizobium sp. ESP-6-2]